MEQLKAAGQGLKAAAAGVAPGAGGSGGLGAWRPPRGAEVYHDEAEDLSFIEPVYATRTAIHPLPSRELPHKSMPAFMAKAMIEDMLTRDFNPRLNLSTFVNTWCEPELEALMHKVDPGLYNLADAVQYPSAAEMEKRCVSFLAHLWHCQDDFVGTGCVGSTEACYLGGLAMKKQWQQRRRAAGLPADRPNIVVSHVAQVCWQKFCSYFDVEPRYVDVTPGCLVMDPEKMRERIDDNTIGVVAMMASTYTGQFEPVQAMDAVLQEIQRDRGWDWVLPMHVDAANAGLVAPLCKPDVVFDFRLPSVMSINVSGHKYGMTMCGCAFVVWRSRAWVPQDMVFCVDYLGKEEGNLTINFSRPAAQIVGQYYNFVRLGRDGLRRTFDDLYVIYEDLRACLQQMGHFEILSTGDMPVLAFRLQPQQGRSFNEYDLMMLLGQQRWMVPAYKMAPAASDMHLLRVCLRVGFDLEMAELLARDIAQAMDVLQKHTSTAVSSPGQAYEGQQEEAAKEFKRRAGPC